MNEALPLEFVKFFLVGLRIFQAAAEILAQCPVRMILFVSVLITLEHEVVIHAPLLKVSDAIVWTFALV